MAVDGKDRSVLRDLAKQVAEMAALPIMAQRREMWKKHNSLQRVRPMILVFPEGAWAELLPPSVLQCEGEQARNIESALRRRLYYGNLPDDTVIEREWPVGRAVRQTGWGLEARRIPSTEARGSWAFDPVIHTADDLKKLTFPEVTCDEAATQRNVQEASELFGDILDVRLRGVRHVSFHLMGLYTGLRGLEQVMVDMCSNRAMLHDAMAFLEEGHRRLVKQYERLNLLDLNNDGTYHSSGGNGYTEELPRPGYDARRVRTCDIWASAEAQEMAQVSPDMHNEFILQYEKRLLEPFGLNGYGCCEDLTRKLEHVFTIPHLRRISISPFADVELCARKLGGRYIFSWKPHPGQLVGDFSADKVRRYIRHCLDATRDCVVEMILKDTHTCEHHPERFTIWTQVARELVDRY